MRPWGLITAEDYFFPFVRTLCILVLTLKQKFYNANFGGSLFLTITSTYLVAKEVIDPGGSQTVDIDRPQRVCL